MEKEIPSEKRNVLQMRSSKDSELGMTKFDLRFVFYANADEVNLTDTELEKEAVQRLLQQLLARVEVLKNQEKEQFESKVTDVRIQELRSQAGEDTLDSFRSAAGRSDVDYRERDSDPCDTESFEQRREILTPWKFLDSGKVKKEIGDEKWKKSVHFDCHSEQALFILKNYPHLFDSFSRISAGEDSLHHEVDHHSKLQKEESVNYDTDSIIDEVVEPKLPITELKKMLVEEWTKKQKEKKAEELKDSEVFGSMISQATTDNLSFCPTIEQGSLHSQSPDPYQMSGSYSDLCYDDFEKVQKPRIRSEENVSDLMIGDHYSHASNCESFITSCECYQCELAYLREVARRHKEEMFNSKSGSTCDCSECEDSKMEKMLVEELQKLREKRNQKDRVTFEKQQEMKKMYQADSPKVSSVCLSSHAQDEPTSVCCSCQPSLKHCQGRQQLQDRQVMIPSTAKTNSVTPTTKVDNISTDHICDCEVCKYNISFVPASASLNDSCLKKKENPSRLFSDSTLEIMDMINKKNRQVGGKEMEMAEEEEEEHPEEVVGQDMYTLSGTKTTDYSVTKSTETEWESSQSLTTVEHTNCSYQPSQLLVSTDWRHLNSFKDDSMDSEAFEDCNDFFSDSPALLNQDSDDTLGQRPFLWREKKDFVLLQKKNLGLEDQKLKKKTAKKGRF